MYIIHAHIKVKPEYRNPFLNQIKTLVQHSQNEEGNISYDLYEKVEGSNAFVMLEEWKDKAAIEFHNQTEHFQEFGKVSKDYLQEPPRVVKYEVTSL